MPEHIQMISAFIFSIPLLFIYKSVLHIHCGKIIKCQ